MQNSLGLFRVLRISPYVRLGVKGYLERNVLLHRRLFHNEGIRNPKYKRNVTYRTAILPGALVVGGLVIYGLNSRTLESHTGDEDQERKQDNDPCCRQTRSLSLSEAVKYSRELLQMKKDESRSPGVSVAVSVDGKTVWAEGLGYSDLENGVKCTPQSVFRIASISKPITMALVAKLVEIGRLDVNKPVQHYVPDFPEKTWEGEKVEITTRQLLSHIGGLRDYGKIVKLNKNESNNCEGSNKQTTQNISPEWVIRELKDETSNKYHYKSVQESLAVFKDDPLLHKPGSQYMYSSAGWTLISVIAEKAAGIPFEDLMQDMFDKLGMENTHLEKYHPLIKNRGRHYIKNKNGYIVNAPYIDMSYKWAGAGYISNVLDLAKFGNAMLFSYQASPLRASSNQDHVEKSALIKDNEETGIPSGFLKPNTMKAIWTPVVNFHSGLRGLKSLHYGMGWYVGNHGHEYAFGKDQTFFVEHSGGAVGASSDLIILPTKNSQILNEKDGSVKIGNAVKSTQETSLPNTKLPKGIVVAIIFNMSQVGVKETAYNIAKIFEQVDFKK